MWVSVYVCLCASYVCWCLLFSRGFLLSRSIVGTESVCVEGGGRSLSAGAAPARLCSPRSFRVVLVVVDALRYDFVGEVKDGEVYHDNMRFVSDLLSEKPQSTRLFEFVADPPTTTSQRLHALATGTLPTFIDAGSNFASSRVDEDNLLRQLQVRGKRAVMLGDDTWVKLFPGTFHREYPMPSFDVWDLDTVDRGVDRRLWTELKEEDWDLLVVHYLGVDHCGHRYGVHHPEMRRKLREMDDVVRRVVEGMGDDTVLVVAGDHGMTQHGDHGGDSRDEVTAALLVHCPGGLRPAPPVSSLRQIDLTPVLAVLLGLPIPSSNLGVLAPQLLPASLPSELYSSLLLDNVHQVTHYLRLYDSLHNSFPQQRMDELLHIYSDLVSSPRDPAFESRAHLYMHSVQEMCRGVWTRFDPVSISLGLVGFSATLLINLAVYLETDGTRPPLAFRHLTLYSMSVGLLYCLKLSLNASAVDTLFYCVSGGGALVLVTSVLRFRTSTWNLSFNDVTLEKGLALSVFIVSAAGPLSNSYIIKENYATNSLVLALVWTLTCRLYFCTSTTSVPGKKQLLLYAACYSVCLRTLHNYWRCYDEESKDCVFNKSQSALKYCWDLVMICSLFTGVWWYRRKVGILRVKWLEAVKWSVVSVYCVMRTEEWIGGSRFKSLATQFVCLACLFVLCLLVVSHERLVSRGNPVEGEPRWYTWWYIEICSFCWLLGLGVLSGWAGGSSVLGWVCAVCLWTLLRAASPHESVAVVAWHLSSVALFYGTGHQPTFPSLQWEVGGAFPHYPLAVPAAFLLLNTFLSQAVHSLTLPLLAPFPSSITVSRLTSLTVLLCACRLLLTMISATVHCRHLMVWKIFAPKFVFEAMAFLVSLASLLLGYTLSPFTSKKVDTEPNKVSR